MAKFKVGDRVRRINSSNGDGMDVGTEWIVAGFKKFYRDDYLVFEGGRDGNAVNFEPVAVAPATATLNIEAGKFYKTRDGRKVGPLIVQDDDEFPFLDDAACESYRPDGSYNFSRNVQSRKDIIAEWVDEPVADHKFKVGDVVNNGHNDRTVAKLVTVCGHLAVEYTTGGWDPESALTLVSRNEPTPIHVTLGIDLNPSLAPQVGDAVLIKGTLAGITHSPRGTNYNIVFETQNRRVSLHFLEEDFILDDRDCGPDCPFANNDNGQAPSADTAKAFDALGSWLNSLAVSRAA